MVSSDLGRAPTERGAEILVIFARFPEPGEVKTRLATELGDASAAALYEAFLRDLALRFRGAPFDVRWGVAPPERGFASRFGIEPAACFAQEGADLGARMQAAFRRSLATPGTRCVLIGSDMPQLSSAIVLRAFDELRHADLVLGPAEDGGYYLIAMQRLHDVFSGIVWSQPNVLEETLARARSLGLEVALLEPGFDVDDARDLERLRGLLASREARETMPHTSAVLELVPPRAPGPR